MSDDTDRDWSRRSHAGIGLMTTSVQALEVSRRDEMMVAWHEMPGKSPEMIRPVGNGMIDGRARRFVLNGGRSVARHNHTVPSGTGFSRRLFQAFHARLSSGSPSGANAA